MTLFKQLALMVSVAFILLFVIGVSVSFNVIKENSQESLFENAQNTASSIVLAIDNVGNNNSAIKTIINASFDNGNYAKIIYQDNDGNEIYNRTIEERNSATPLWFKNLIKIDNIPAKASVSDGWQIVGTIVVYSDLEVIYLQLYDIFFKLSIYLAIAYLFILSILYVFLNYILRPLFSIEKQASAILDNKFILSQKLPKTIEFYTVAKSMNLMVNKVEQIFQSANSALKYNKELLYVDDVTKLYNRKYFILKASEYISDNSAFSSGILVVINIKQAELMNKLIGYKNTDKFLIDMANEMNNLISTQEIGFVARLNGTEFVAMIPNSEYSNIEKNLIEFRSKLYSFFETLELKNSNVELNIAVCKYHEEKNVGELFARIDYALSNAKLSHCCELVLVDDNNLNIGKEQWRSILVQAIENDNFTFDSVEIINTKNNEIYCRNIAINLFVDDQQYSYGEFIAPLVELKLLYKFYFYVIEKIFYEKLNEKNKVSLSLPYNFIEEDSILKEFDSLFDTYEYSKMQNIIFELPEEAFNRRFEHTLHLIQIFEKYGVKYAINDYIANINDYTFLENLKPEYIILDKNFILDSEQNLDLINIIMKSIGVNIVASGAFDNEEINQLQSLKVCYCKNRIV